MSEQHPFDVFLAHNSQDKPQIREIYQALKQRGINPWLDEEEIPPGTPFLEEIQKAITLVKTVAVFMGPKDLGRWQVIEMQTAIRRFVENDIKVIPVLLPGVVDIPSELIFLSGFNAVILENDVTDEKGLSRLEWGITGQKPSVRTKDTPKLEQTTKASQPSSDASSPTEGQKKKPLDPRYADLEKYLKAQEWKKADNETYRLMINQVGRKEGDYFRASDLKNYPCNDLRIIDQLWVQHSDGLFGFSVQKKIWEECGSPQEYNKAWKNFGDRVGWRTKNNWLSYDSLNPSLSSPKGNFPGLLGGWGLGWDGWEVVSLLSRPDL